LIWNRNQGSDLDSGFLGDEYETRQARIGMFRRSFAQIQSLSILSSQVVGRPAGKEYRFILGGSAGSALDSLAQNFVAALSKAHGFSLPRESRHKIHALSISRWILSLCIFCSSPKHPQR
jgi:hypothetical protein